VPRYFYKQVDQKKRQKRGDWLAAYSLPKAMARTTKKREKKMAVLKLPFDCGSN
jgi:hypothetical protein